MEKSVVPIEGIYNEEASQKFLEFRELSDIKQLKSGFYSHLFKIFPKLEHSQGSGKIADFGCGAGNLTRFLASKLPQANQIVGIDGSATFIEKCLENLSADPSIPPRAKSRVRYICGDLTDEHLRILDPAEVKFDYVISQCVLHHFPTYEQLTGCLKLAFKNLDVGGHMLIELTTLQHLCLHYEKTKLGHNSETWKKEMVAKLGHAESTKSAVEIDYLVGELGCVFNSFYWPDLVVIGALKSVGFQEARRLNQEQWEIDATPGSDGKRLESGDTDRHRLFLATKN